LIAAALDSGESDIGMLETTDPHLAGGKLVALADDRGCNPRITVPAFIRILDFVSAQLTTTSHAELKPARRHRRRTGGASRPRSPDRN
jgi:glycine betaine/choline ABC-type transport system substrate-binding protein